LKVVFIGDHISISDDVVVSYFSQNFESSNDEIFNFNSWRIDFF
jgi:hypothetical protein